MAHNLDTKANFGEVFGTRMVLGGRTNSWTAHKTTRPKSSPSNRQRKVSRIRKKPVSASRNPRRGPCTSYTPSAWIAKAIEECDEIDLVLGLFYYFP